MKTWGVKLFYYSEVNGFDFGEVKATNLRTWDYESSLFADVNGDGFSDYMTHAGADLTLYKRTQKPLRQIQKVIDGYGLESHIGYIPLTDSNVYTRGDISATDTSSYGNGSRVLDMIYPMYAVANYKKGEMVNQYRYENGLTQIGRGSLGFGKLTVHNLTTGMKEVAEYHQNFPFVGALKQKKSYVQEVSYSTVENCVGGADYEPYCFDVQVTHASNLKLSQTDVVYGRKYTHGDKSSFIYVDNSTETFWDINDQVKATHIKQTSLVAVGGDKVDEFGHPLEQKVKVTDYTQNGISYSTTTKDTWGTDHYGKRLTDRVVTLNRSNANSTIVRESKYEYHATSGLLSKEIREPNDIKFKLETAYTDRDSFGNAETVTVTGADIDTRVSKYAYDSTGRFIQTETAVVNADDASKNHVLTYNRGAKAKAFGYVDSTNDANGFTTSWTYSPLGRKQQESADDGSGSRIAYQWCTDLASGDNRLTVSCSTGAVYRKVTLSKGQPTVIEEFDQQARILRSKSMAFDQDTWIVNDTTYDELGRIAREYQPQKDARSSYYTEYHYDKLNRVVKTKRPDGSYWHTRYTKFAVTQYSPSIAEPTKQYSLNQTPSGVRYHTEIKDASGKLVEVRDFLPNEGKTLATKYKYDNAGNLIELDGPTSGVGDRITLGYGEKGYFKETMSDPDKGDWSYRYDQLGNLTWQKDGNNNESSLVYDNLGRVIDHIRYNGTLAGGVKQRHIKNVYDTAKLGSGAGKAKGLLASSEDLAHVGTGVVKQLYEYDAKGRLNTVYHTLEDAVYTESTEYDAIGRAYKKTDAANGTTEYLYNDQGYNFASRDPDTGVVYFWAKGQDQFGNLTSYSVHNDVTAGGATYYQTTGLTHILTAGDGASIQDEEYAWDTLGNLSWRKDHNQNLTEDFVYDDLNRLTDATVNSLATQSVEYADNGNITFKTGVGYYCYDAGLPHAVSGLTSTKGAACADTWEYDGNGNLTSGKTTDGLTRTLSYNNADKPVTIKVADTYTASFSYGIGDARYKRVDDKGGEITTTWYVGNVEFVDKGGVTTTKRHIDGLVQVVQQDNKPELLEYTYLFKDHLGSIVATVDHTGSSLQRFSFDAWGQRRGAEWALPGHTPATISEYAGQTLYLPVAIEQTRGFTGHEQVDDAGLIHMNGRIYDPVLGRFLSADPFIQAATNSQSLNRYSYVWNNPLNATDPSGYIVVTAIAALASAAVKYGVVAQITTTILTAYQIYNTFQMVKSVINAYNAWNSGGGGAIWGNLIGGAAKGFLISAGISATVNASFKASFEAGGSTTDVGETGGQGQDGDGGGENPAPESEVPIGDSPGQNGENTGPDVINVTDEIYGESHSSIKAIKTSIVSAQEATGGNTYTSQSYYRALSKLDHAAHVLNMEGAGFTQDDLMFAALNMNFQHNSRQAALVAGTPLAITLAGAGASSAYIYYAGISNTKRMAAMAILGNMLTLANDGWTGVQKDFIQEAFYKGFSRRIAPRTSTPQGGKPRIKMDKNGKLHVTINNN